MHLSVSGHLSYTAAQELPLARCENILLTYSYANNLGIRAAVKSTVTAYIYEPSFLLYWQQNYQSTFACNDPPFPLLVAESEPVV